MPQLAEVRAYLLLLAVAIVAILASVLIADDVDGFGRALLDSSFSTTTMHDRRPALRPSTSTSGTASPGSRS